MQEFFESVLLPFFLGAPKKTGKGTKNYVEEKKWMKKENTIILEKFDELERILYWFAENRSILVSKVAKDAMSLNTNGLVALTRIFSTIYEQVNIINETKHPCPFLYNVREGEPHCKSDCEHCKYRIGCTVYRAINEMLQTASFIAIRLSRTI